MAYNKGVRFEWDPNKAKANWENHRVSFDEVTQLFTSGIDFRRSSMSRIQTMKSVSLQSARPDVKSL